MSKYKFPKDPGSEYPCPGCLAVLELEEANRIARAALQLELIKLIDPAQAATFVFDFKDLA